MPESTGGDAPAAAAAPAAPGAELMSGKKSHNVRRHSCMRSVCREHFADISQKYFHFGEKHCAAAMDVLLAGGLTVLFFNSVQCHC